MALMDGSVQGLNLKEALNSVIELMNYEEDDEWFSNSPSNLLDQMFPSFPISPSTSTFAPLDGLSSMEHHVPNSLLGDSDNMMFRPGASQFPIQIYSDDDKVDLMMKRRYKNSREHSAMASDVGNGFIPRPPKQLLEERMMRALHLLKGWFGGGTLAQVWIPMKNGDQYILSTNEKPFLHDDEMLSGYREVSKLFTFSAELRPGSFPGLPGRVFTSKVPEWTSNVMYYDRAEYLRVQHAIDHNVRGSIALPVFEDDSSDHERSCCAVLELVTTKEKPNFDSEMDDICQALQAVELSSTLPPRLYPQSLSKNQNATLAEIKDVLCAICHAHRLPLALTWIPCSYTENAGHETRRVRARDHSISPNESSILCIEETACYWNEIHLEGFVHACVEHFLEEGQGVVGKALKSNQPFFYPDVKKFHISEYPLVHHARKFGLCAAVAIRLRSTYPGGGDYVLEFFLPVNAKGAMEPQLVLNNISNSTDKIFRSLRRVSDIELLRERDTKVDSLCYEVKDIPPIASSTTSTEQLVTKDEFNSIKRENVCELNTSELKDNHPPKKAMIGSSKPREKKRSIWEKYVSLSDIQPYFSGSLKDASKKLGVCPTTLKRICRRHGISRWPSRKIRKVNRSLQRIQSVLESVQEVDEGFMFDLTSGKLVPAGSVIENSDPGKSFFLTCKNSLALQSDTVIQNSISVGSTSCIDCEATDVKMEKEDLFDVPTQNVSCSLNEELKTKAPLVESCDESRLAALDMGPLWPASMSTMPWMTPPIAPTDSSFLSKVGRSGQELCSGKKETKNFESCFISACSSSIIGGDDVDNMLRGSPMIDKNGVVGLSKSTSSGMTESSNGSGSFDEKSPLKTEASCKCSGTKITVKAIYKGDTIRFKFDPGAGCSELYSEVAKRFQLQTEQFQLKYLDDEEEWVMLVNDSDLLECLEVMDFLSTQTVRFLVFDVLSGARKSVAMN